MARSGAEFHAGRIGLTVVQRSKPQMGIAARVTACGRSSAACAAILATRSERQADDLVAAIEAAHGLVATRVMLLMSSENRRHTHG